VKGGESVDRLSNKAGRREREGMERIGYMDKGVEFGERERQSYARGNEIYEELLV